MAAAVDGSCDLRDNTFKPQATQIEFIHKGINKLDVDFAALCKMREL